MVRSLLPLQGAWIGCLVEKLTSGCLVQPSGGDKNSRISDNTAQASGCNFCSP